MVKGSRAHIPNRLVKELLRHHAKVLDLPRVLLEDVGEVVVEFDLAMHIAACYDDVGTMPAICHLHAIDDQVECDA